MYFQLLSIITAIAVSIWNVSIASAQTGLADLAGSRMSIGFAIDSKFLPGQSSFNQLYVDTVLREANVLVAENDMKFESLQPTRDNFNFTKGDLLVSFAEANGMKVRGHALVWHQQNAPWVKAGNFTGAQLDAIMKKHITTVIQSYATRYPGTVVAWDVVNESISAGTGSVWSRIGFDYVERAFRYAREADPNVKLFFNEYGAEALGSKSDRVYNLVKSLKAKGLIDGVGLQMHIGTASGLPNTDRIRQNIQRLAALGLDVHITELDVAIKVSDGVTKAELNVQADRYGKILTACLSSPRCNGFLTWGVYDGASWIPSYFPGKGDALLFDRAFKPKPAYLRLQSLLSNSPPTSPAVVTIQNIFSSKCVDVAGGSVANGTAIQQWDCTTNNLNQQFNVSKNSDGSYTFTNVKTAKCIDVPGTSPANGVLLQQYDCLNGNANQQFQASQTSTGVYSLAAVVGGKCWDIYGEQNGVRVQLYSCYASNKQRFKLNTISGSLP